MMHKLIIFYITRRMRSRFADSIKLARQGRETEALQSFSEGEELNTLLTKYWENEVSHMENRNQFLKGAIQALTNRALIK